MKDNSIACKKLPVSGAFHSKLMENAKITFREFLDNEKIFFNKLNNVEILSTISEVNFYKKISTDDTEDEKTFDHNVKEILIKQLTEPVNLLNCIKFNIKNGIKIFDMNKRKFIDNEEYV
jgi:malonyl CoA-acyl carrier protein transacylase